MPAEPAEDRADVVGLDIFRRRTTFGADSLEDFLVFELFLAKYRPDIDQRLLDIRSYEGPFEERLEKVLSVYASLLQSEAKDILTGERWEEGFYAQWV